MDTHFRLRAGSTFYLLFIYIIQIQEPMKLERDFFLFFFFAFSFLLFLALLPCFLTNKTKLDYTALYSGLFNLDFTGTCTLCLNDSFQFHVSRFYYSQCHLKGYVKAVFIPFCPNLKQLETFWCYLIIAYAWLLY